MNVASRASQLLSSQSIGDLLNSDEAFLFDCDGVIWKGDTLIDGVPQTFDMLRSKGKKLVFVTNNSTKSRRQYANKFQSLGISVTEDEIFSSSFAAAMFLKVKNFPKDKKEDGKKTGQWKTNCLFEHDKMVGAVVVGLDPYVNYYKLQV
ncbi:hypothetical protein I3760_09G107300 [Carya illinoinensis]|nr:hypothetical protein I3760_09G107300 [Carya illinoinensis]